MAENSQVQKTLDTYRAGYTGSNLVHTNCFEEHRFAKHVLSSELQRGEVEFFCGSGVGRDVTGVDWIGLVNEGASKVLEAKPETVLAGSSDLQLVKECFVAFGDQGSPAQRKVVLDRFQGSYFGMVKAYANAVDSCCLHGAAKGLPCPKSYNQFIAEFMGECHARPTCPTQTARVIAKAIVAQLHSQQHKDRLYAVYTTNYSRAINFALLELGVTIEEIYMVRWRTEKYSADLSLRGSDSKYGEDMEVIRSVLTPANPIGHRRVIVFHLHGIAKSSIEFTAPNSPGPEPRALWARQEHFSLGMATSFFQDKKPISFVKPWDTVSPCFVRREFPAGTPIDDLRTTLPDGTPKGAMSLYHAAAEGIVITDTHYACLEHVECLKGCFRMAMDDTGRTVVLLGSSMTDEFFGRFLEECNDENAAAAGSVDPMNFLETPAQGIAIQVCVKPKASFVEEDDVKSDLKPYLLFVISVNQANEADYPGIQKYIQDCTPSNPALESSFNTCVLNPLSAL